MKESKKKIKPVITVVKPEDRKKGQVTMSNCHCSA